MLLLETLKESFSSLIHNKMRTFLSTLGIMIGIASVIALLSLGTATQTQITTQIESLGVNKITVMAGRSTSKDTNNLKMSDVEFLRGETFSKYFTSVVPLLTASGTMTYQSKTVSGSLNGIDQYFYQDQTKLDKIEYGRALTEDDIFQKNKNIVIGSEIASELFGNSQNALGRNLKFQNQFWTVVGVLAEASSSADSDTGAYAPIGAVSAYVPGVSQDKLSNITINVIDSDEVEQSQNLIKYVFMQRRGIAKIDDLNLRTMSAKDMLESMTSMMGTVTGLLAGIAAISLLVGGIGIMNIMLVTVTERTREIGLRKALGAKRKTIILQFLTESVVLTLLGGVFGFVLGIVLAWVGTKLMSVDFVIAWSAVLLGISVSTLIGLGFGIYPAWKASKLQPIEALRYD